MPTDTQKAELETLLQVSEGKRISRFDNYRQGPVRISGPAFNEAVDRYLELHEFGMDSLDFSHIPPVRLKNIARYAGIISMHKIARMPKSKRTAVLVAFVKSFETIALDDALDVLNLLLTEITGKAKRLGQKKRLRTLKDLDKSALALAKICTILINNNKNNDDQLLNEIIFKRFSKAKIEEYIDIINTLTRPSNDKYFDEMVEQYGRVRQFLPRLLNNIVFKAAPAGRVTLDAFNYLASLDKSHKQTLENPPLDIISTP